MHFYRFFHNYQEFWKLRVKRPMKKKDEENMKFTLKNARRKKKLKLNSLLWIRKKETKENETSSSDEICSCFRGRFISRNGMNNLTLGTILMFYH